MPQQEVNCAIVIGQLLDWIEAPFRSRWQPGGGGSTLAPLGVGGGVGVDAAIGQHLAWKLRRFPAEPVAAEMPMQPRKREEMLRAVRADVRALQFASEEFRCDRDFILAAVEQHFFALQFASEGLPRDPSSQVKAITIREEVVALPERL